ncbi:MAG TPA: hypothetical protein VMX13_01050 [Sedimentisphaerales bacterium]|nr:hypothetical protein [Sedimentisphaerales bacterium]
MSDEADMENRPKVPDGQRFRDSDEIAGISVITSPGVRDQAGQTNEQGWRLNRQVNISVLVQLVFLASLIVGSWVNLQRQLDLLQHDVTYLCECQKNFERKLELLQEKSISYECRLRAVEKWVSTADVREGCLRP